MPIFTNLDFWKKSKRVRMRMQTLLLFSCFFFLYSFFYLLLIDDNDDEFICGILFNFSTTRKRVTSYVKFLLHIVTYSKLHSMNVYNSNSNIWAELTRKRTKQRQKRKIGSRPVFQTIVISTWTKRVSCVLFTFFFLTQSNKQVVFNQIKMRNSSAN